MSGTTTHRALPYPSLSDTADVPRDIQALALALDSDMQALSGTLAAIPGTHISGRTYRVTSGAGVGDIYYDTGSVWQKIYTPQPKLNALTLNAGWSVFDGALVPSYSDPMPDNEVVLSGLISWGLAAIPTVGTNDAAPMFTIPAGSRPAKQETFQVAIGNSALSLYGTGVIECKTDGTVHFRTALIYHGSLTDPPGTGLFPNWNATFVWLNQIKFYHSYS